MTGLGSLLAVLARLLRDLTQLVLSPSAPHPSLALAAAVLAGAMLAAGLAFVSSVADLCGTAALPLIRRARALREKSWRAAFLRQRDPDAAGRARPRAPSAAPAAALSR
jgi:hypothetical protein